MFAQNIHCVHVNGLPYFKGITYLPLLFHFVLFLFNVPVNKFTVMSGYGKPSAHLFFKPKFELQT